MAENLKVENELKQGANVDELAKRIVSSGVVKEDTALFLAQNWQKLIGIAAIFVLFVIIYNQYQNTQKSRLVDASSRFDTILLNFDKYLENGLNKDIKENNELTLILENIKAIDNTHQDLKYAKYSSIYKMIIDGRSKNYDELNKIAQSLNAERFYVLSSAKKLTDVKSNDLVSELAALVKLRFDIEQDSADFNEIKNKIAALIYNSRFVTEEVVLLLFRINSKDTQFNSEVLNKLFAVRPEIKSAIVTALNSQGFNYQD